MSMPCLHATNGESVVLLGTPPHLPMHKTAAGEAPRPQTPRAAEITSVDLRQLTAAVKRGDEAAFMRFHELYGFRLYKLALAFTGGREIEAGEVLQSVMIKLTRRFEVFHNEKRLWTWLCSVLRHCYIDYYRQQKRDQRFVPLESSGAESADVDPTADRLVVALLAAMDELPPDDRELLRAFYLDKRSLCELADESGRSYKAIESHMTRLRRKVKESLLAHLQNEDPLRS